MAAKVVLLVGCGAVKEAWAPVCRALKRDVSRDMPMWPDLANQEMARVVHLLRFFGPNGKVKQSADFDSLREAHAQLRKAICEELQSAHLEPQRELDHVVAAFVPLAADFVVLNANWDDAVDKRVKRLHGRTRVKHIHGTMEDSNTLYLPTEISVDAFRSDAEKRALSIESRDAIRELEDATQVVVYGLSLSPLDAELCNIIWSSRHDRHCSSAQWWWT